VSTNGKRYIFVCLQILIYKKASKEDNRSSKLDITFVSTFMKNNVNSFNWKLISFFMEINKYNRLQNMIQK